jgi:cell division protein FtsQ
MKTLKLLLKIALAVGIIVVAIVAAVVMKNRNCEDIKISFFPPVENTIIASTDILTELTKHGLDPRHKKIKEIRTDSITKRLNQNLYVQEVKGVYFSGNTLHIDLVLQQPILHLYSQSGEQYLMAESGLIMPWTSSVKARLLVANGYIPIAYKKGMQADADSTLKQVYQVARAIDDDPFFRSQIAQIYLNGQKEMEMVPLIGDQTILIGDASQIEEKLKTLHTVYEKGIIYEGIDKYAGFDVRFINRVIARQK